jgi:uncharacterized protein YjbI with pentapeptide repeats
MTKKELVKLLVDNFKDEVGNLDLSGLDFTNEDLNCVIISEMKVNRHLFQNRQQVQGSLWQDEQEVSGSIWQSNQTVKGNLYQNRQQVKRELWQGNQKVEGDLRQDYQEVKEICIIKNKMTKEQLVKFLVDNFKDEQGFVNLSGLDFRGEDIKGVVISKMKVNGYLFQEKQKVQWDLIQEAQEVNGDLYQGFQEVKGDLYD